MFVVPAVNVATNPVPAFTVATKVFVLLQLPPVVASVKDVIAPEQIVVVPVTEAGADGKVITETAIPVASLPQLLVTE